eukprot:5537591-Prymnesium_polylepis.1
MRSRSYTACGYCTGSRLSCARARASAARGQGFACDGELGVGSPAKDKGGYGATQGTFLLPPKVKVA